MARFVRSAEEVATTFGYHPQPADLLALLQTVRFTRLVVVAGRVRDVVDHVGSIRTGPEVALPRGLYWFAGLDEPLAMVVNTGAASDGVAVGLDELTEADPLASAYDWAEQLWDDGLPVPTPAFAVGDDVVTRAGGRDSQVRERAFNAGSWLYKIRLDGTPPRPVRVRPAEVTTRVAQEVTDLLERHPGGTVAVIALICAEVVRALRRAGVTVDPHDVSKLVRQGRAVRVLDPEQARGLEFDAVVVVEPGAFPKRAGQHGLLYTSLTRADRELVLVHAEPLPSELRTRVPVGSTELPRQRSTSVRAGVGR